MPKIYNIDELKFSKRDVPVEKYNWETSERLGALSGAKNLFFDVRKLLPGTYSFPYHYHEQSEEIFLILDGEATLRTPEGKQIVKKNDIVFFEIGPTSAHQLYNHTSEVCLYFDLRTFLGLDVGVYPDSGRVGIFPNFEFYDIQKGKVGYFDGEENPDKYWENL